MIVNKKTIEGETESDRFTISAVDGQYVSIFVQEAAGEEYCAGTNLTPHEARTAANRLMQAADLADPERGDYRQRWY